MLTDTSGLPLVLDVTTTELDRSAAIAAGGRRLAAAARPRRGAFQNFVLWMAIGLAVSWLLGSQSMPFQTRATLWVGLGALFLGWIVFQSWRQRRHLIRTLAEAQTGAYRLSLDEDGVAVDGEGRHARLSWTEIEGIEPLAECLMLHLKGYASLAIPLRCLPQGVTPEALLARIGEATGRPAGFSAPAGAGPKAPGASLLADLGRNLAAGLGFLALRRGAASRLVASVPQLVLLLLLSVLLAVAMQWWRVEGKGELDAGGLAPLFFGVPWLLLTAWAGARAGMKEHRTVAAAVALAALWLVLNGVQVGLAFLPQEVWTRLGGGAVWLLWGPVVWGYVASVPALVRSVGMLPEHRLGAVLAVLYLLTVPLLITGNAPPLIEERPDPAAAKANRERWEKTTREAVLYAQPRLLDAALDGVQPGLPGVPEIFLLAVGGYGGQDVFLREVRAVEAMFQERFGTAGHSIVLVNNPATIEERPIASVTALARSLERIGQRMNREEDILFLFMTSHGARDHRFDLSLWPYRFDDLTPERLRALLDKAGIRYRVVVVSACYSGGFIAPLGNDDTLVMSAAAEDRNSHGCSHEADWTFFGRAYFQEALAGTWSFETAFDLARAAVAKRETAEGFEPSRPQIAAGNGIRVALKALERHLARRQAVAAALR